MTTSFRRDGLGSHADSLSLCHGVFRNWLVLNFCALVPLWVLAFGWVADQIKVTLSDRSDCFVAVLADDEELGGYAYDSCPGTQLWHFHLPRNMSVSRLAFRVSANRGKDAILRIELQKWHFFAFELDLDRLELRDATNQTYTFRTPCFAHVSLASRSLAWALLVLQIFLAAASWWAARRRPRAALRTSFLPALSAAAVFALVWHILLPLQTYWGNRSEFPFPVAELVSALLPRFAATTAAGTLALTLLGACFGVWIPWMVVATAVGFHLESVFLSFGLPALNGNWLFYADPTRAAWDALIWMALFAASLLLARTPRKILPITASLLFLWMLLSLMDVRRQRDADSSRLLVSDFVPIAEIPHSLSYSSHRNILVFVIDSLEREQAHAAIHDPDDGPLLQNAFAGFTEFADNLGAMPSSGYSVANMFTGKYFELGDSSPDFFMSVFSSDSVLKDFLDAGWDVHLATSSLGKGFSSRPRRPDAPLLVAPKPLPPPDRPMQGAFPWSLADVCRFRSMPFAFRFKYLRILSGEFPPFSFTREWFLYPRLASAPVEPDIPGTLLFVHTEGVHIPVMHDRRGNLLAIGRNNDKRCVDMAVFLLHQLADLFDAYRAMGIYDDALILVLADHGNHENNARTLPSSSPLPGNARPFLWVKPPHSRHPFETSSAPTSHARIHSLLRHAIQAPPSAADLPALLRMDTRLYRSVPAGRAFDDWLVSPDGSCSLNGSPVSSAPHP